MLPRHTIFEYRQGYLSAPMSRYVDASAPGRTTFQVDVTIMVMKRMPPRRQSSSVDFERRIRQLENELFIARRSIIDLMRPELESLLSGHYRCATFDDVERWADETTDGIICFAAKGDGRLGVVTAGSRVYCPLCGQGTQSMARDEGFLLPVGLRRHLLGTYNARQCSVFRAAQQLALDSARSR